MQYSNAVFPSFNVHGDFHSFNVSPINSYKLLRVGFNNVNCLSNKVIYVSHVLHSSNIDVMGIAETWLFPYVLDSFVSVSGYRVVRGDVGGSVAKHGVCLYLRSNLNFVVDDVVCANACCAYLVDFDLYVLVIYRPPSYGDDENRRLLAFLADFCLSKELIILGDFNLPGICWSGDSFPPCPCPPLQRNFFDLFTLLGLTQWVKSPTFIYSDNILDLVLTTEGDRIGEMCFLPCLPGCGHVPLFFDYFFQWPFDVNSGRLQRRAWHRGDYVALNGHFASVDWEYEFSDLDLDSMVGKFNSIVESHVNIFVPVVSQSVAKRDQFRIPNTLRKNRRDAWSRYKQLRSNFGRNSQISKDALHVFQNVNFEFRNFLVRAQIDYERDLVERLSEAPKLFHRYIRSKKVGNPSVGPLRNSDNDLVVDCSEMAEIFVSKFVSVFSSGDLVCPPLNHQVSDGMIDSSLFEVENVLSLLQSLDVNSSMGPDGIHPCILKYCQSLALPLNKIFRCSVDSGRVPVAWKISEVVPLFKKGSRSDALNYRPISLTSVCCKTLERLIASSLVDYLEENNILCDDQFGFRRGMTVDDQLLLVYNEVSLWLDQGYSSDVILFDFRKAFDVVSHTVLLHKLGLLGVSGSLLSWIRSFLTGRFMRVVVSDARSSSHAVCSGVPQGSVLGPLLFIIYVNHIPSLIRSRCKFFADDLKIYLKIRYSPDEFREDFATCQADIEIINSVAKSWGLFFNIDKCSVLSFRRRRHPSPEAGSPSPYLLDGHPILFSDCSADLGVTVDTSLKFHAHIRQIVNKASGLANNLLRSTLCRSRVFMCNLFKSHIRPLLEFSSTVWCTGYVGDMRLLESVQRRWTKRIDGLTNMSYGDRLRILGLYSVKGRLLRADLIKCWKIFHGFSAVSPSSLFSVPTVTHTRGHRYKIHKPHVSMELRRRFFSVRCIDNWNSLPDVVVGAGSIDAFKAGLHSFLGDSLFSYVE